MLKHLDMQSQESERRYMEFEERMRAAEREYDAKRRKEDNEHLLRMQQGFTQQMQQMFFMFASGHMPLGQQPQVPTSESSQPPHTSPDT